MAGALLSPPLAQRLCGFPCRRQPRVRVAGPDAAAIAVGAREGSSCEVLPWQRRPCPARKNREVGVPAPSLRLSQPACSPGGSMPSGKRVTLCNTANVYFFASIDC